MLGLLALWIATLVRLNCSNHFINFREWSCPRKENSSFQAENKGSTFDPLLPIIHLDAFWWACLSLFYRSNIVNYGIFAKIFLLFFKIFHVKLERGHCGHVSAFITLSSLSFRMTTCLTLYIYMLFQRYLVKRGQYIFHVYKTFVIAVTLISGPRGFSYESFKMVDLIRVASGYFYFFIVITRWNITAYSAVIFRLHSGSRS